MSRFKNEFFTYDMMEYKSMWTKHYTDEIMNILRILSYATQENIELYSLNRVVGYNGGKSALGHISYETEDGSKEEVIDLVDGSIKFEVGERETITFINEASPFKYKKLVQLELSQHTYMNEPNPAYDEQLARQVKPKLKQLVNVLLTSLKRNRV